MPYSIIATEGRGAECTNEVHFTRMYVCIYIDVEHHGMATTPEILIRGPFTHTVHTYIGQLLCC